MQHGMQPKLIQGSVKNIAIINSVIIVLQQTGLASLNYETLGKYV
jgi:hypothetical protein